MMKNEEQLKKVFERFEWSGVVGLLPDRSENTLQDLLSLVSKTGVLIRVYDIGAAKDAKRAQFIEDLKSFVASSKIDQAEAYLAYLLSQVAITEAAIREIDETLAQDPFSSLPADRQAWSILSWAATEMLDVHRQMNEGVQARTVDGGLFIDPLNLRVDKAHGSSLADGRIYQLAQTAENTLRLLGHRNKWNASEAFVIPARVEVSADDLKAAARVARFGDVWQGLIDESLYHRSWGGYFKIRRPNREQLSVSPGLEVVFDSVKTARERRDDMQIAEQVAQTRLQRWLLSVSRGISRTDAKGRIRPPRVEPVELAPTQLVSELEFVSLYVLDRIYHYDPVNNTELYGGLTLLEWLRGYSVLEEAYAGGVAPDVAPLVAIDASEFSATLERAGLHASKAATFIKRVTFQRDRRDFYDAPLIRSADGKLYFVAALYHGVDLALVIASQIGSLRKNVDAKGKTFEKYVLKLFQDASIPAASFKFKIAKVEYDCDVAVLWDDQLLVFECKNYSLPTDSPTERFYFWHRQVEALSQVERISGDLALNPDIIRKHFGANAKWKAIHPVVLNALPFSIRATPKGTYFYDASALGRFLEKGTVDEVREIPNNQGVTRVSVTAKRLWKGATPSAQDLLREMKYPSQISMEEDKYFISRYLLPLSPGTAFMFQEAASKPPDFEPVAAKKSKGKSPNTTRRSQRPARTKDRGRVKR